MFGAHAHSNGALFGFKFCDPGVGGVGVDRFIRIVTVAESSSQFFGGQGAE